MTSLIAGAGLGAALAFILDPNGGRARRARARDKMIRATRVTRDGLDATAKDVANRARGSLAAARGRLAGDPADDAKLVERARAKLGRVCSHPRAIDMVASEGRLTLRGPILADEAELVLSAMRTVRGATGVADELERHENAEGIPSLQGEGGIAGPSIDLLQNRWAPATRALVGAGAVATITGLTVAARRVTSGR